MYHGAIYGAKKGGNNVTRAYSLNTNGLSIGRRGGRFDDLCKVVKEVNTDIVWCQEHNLDTTRSSATAQQQSLLIQSRDPLTPRQAFKCDIRSFLQTSITQGSDVLLVGDINVVFGSERNGMSKSAAEFRLINLMHVRHQRTPPATYVHRKKCLVYGLATRRVANALTQCGYETFSERFSTDHRANFFDLDNDLLSGNMTQKFAPPAFRVLKSNNVEQVTSYIKLKYDFLQSSNTFRRAEQLTLPGNRHIFAERLDSDVLKASLDAKQKIKPFREPARSAALSKTRGKKVILKKWLTMQLTGLDHSHIIWKDLTTFGIEMELPTSKQQCNSMMRETQSQPDQERDLRIQALDNSLAKADRTHARLLRRLKRNEKVKRACKKIKAARMKGQHQGFTRLKIPLSPSADPKTLQQMADN